MDKAQRLHQIIAEHQAQFQAKGNEAVTSNREIIESFTSVNGETQGHLLNIMYQHHQVHSNILRAMERFAVPETVIHEINSMWCDSMAESAARLSTITGVKREQVLTIISTAQQMTDRMRSVLQKHEQQISEQLKREFGE